MKKTVIFLAVFILSFTAALSRAQDGKKVRVFLAGDSTVQDVDHDKNPD